jgi:hypothetical protein
MAQPDFGAFHGLWLGDPMTAHAILRYQPEPLDGLPTARRGSYERGLAPCDRSGTERYRRVSLG